MLTLLFKGLGERESFRDWSEEGFEDELVGWGGLTFALWLDGRATQIVRVEDEPMLVAPMWELLNVEMVDEDGSKWVGVGNNRFLSKLRR